MTKEQKKTCPRCKKPAQRLGKQSKLIKRSLYTCECGCMFTVSGTSAEGYDKRIVMESNQVLQNHLYGE